MPKWPRVLAMMVAIWFMIAGLKGLVVGIGALALHGVRDLIREAKPGLDERYVRLGLIAGLYVGAAALPHLSIGALYLAWKRFASGWASVLCFLDACFWGIGLAALTRGIPMWLAAFLGIFGALHLGAGFVFLHPSVRTRHAGSDAG